MRATSGGQRDPNRGQSNVIGVAILLGVTVVALGALTASIGAVIESNAATADADRVADGLDEAIRPVETTGHHRARVSVSGGGFRTEPRELRVLDETGVVTTTEVGALVYESDGRTVRTVGGAILRGGTGGSEMSRPPQITASRRSGGVLVIGAARLNATGVSTGGTGRTDLVFRSNVSHDRRALGDATYRIAIETETPTAWRSYFEDLNATVVTVDHDFDDDGVSSVVARFEGDRTAYLIVHDLRLEVNNG
ncbi:DUF7289 family protein [Halostella pelagica]|uniref:DUF7289 family protein n=1 Tax=Halostella pelagica TaxID=2583824 RepID=UPI0010810C44|nr:archaellin/type IV pilin N-terminal domain-containing protein [Halostella pelagica]